MNRKQLKINRFGECILSDIDSFTFFAKDIHQKYLPHPNNDPDVYSLLFKWCWNGYTGYGQIDFYRSNSTLCNIFGENESSITIHSESKRQQPNGRATCSLYNDQSLKPLFNLIISKTNLIPTR